MKAYVLGTGRSGTTALYVVLQEIFSRHCRNAPHFFYEPFLRNIHFLDGRYADVASRMDLQASLSIEGMYQHLRLPLFIAAPAPFRKNSYLRGIFHPPGNRRDVLIKFIRASGRFLLFREICPEAKAIFIIRNPVDVLNSLRQRFSVFGTDFHDDDFPRFADELTKIYGLDLPRNPAPSDLEKSLLYWYHMNRFALESFAKVPQPERPLVLCHDELSRAPECLVKKICDFLAVPFEKKYLQTAQTRVGSVSRLFIMAESERGLFSATLKKYSELLSQHGIASFLSEEEILGRYRLVKKAVFQKKRFPGLHVRAQEREYESLLGRLGKSPGKRYSDP